MLEPDLPTGPGPAARAVLREAKRLAGATGELSEREAEAQDEVRAAYASLHERAVRKALAEMPLSAVNEAAGGAASSRRA